MNLVNEKVIKTVTYSDGFLSSLNSVLDTIDTMLTKMNKEYPIGSHYGICNSCYKIRLITPTDISTYIEAIMKMYQSSYFSELNPSDISSVTVAMAKKFVIDNDGVSFESSTFDNHSYINPTLATLGDLTMSCINDVYAQCVYSPWEMHERYDNETFKADIKRVTDIYFLATMRRMITQLPDIITKSVFENDYIIIKAMMESIEEFILFSAVTYMLTCSSILNYMTPSAEFEMNKTNIGSLSEDADANIVTECAMIRTNDLTLKEKVPFICNMRDVVLQDMTSTFKDTKAALRYIINDSRSPISILVKRFNDKSNELSYRERKYLWRICKDDSPYNNGGIESAYQSLDNSYDAVGFDTNVNWLDKIAYGNNYINANYRRDQVGNQHINSINENLNILYKLYAGYELTTNSDLANNIMSIYKAMAYIISEYSDNNIKNTDLCKDILCVLGEIMTRNMMKLYDNNTKIINASDAMDDTMIPGYFYNESFIMEADDNATPAPTATLNGGTTNSNNNGTNVVKDIINKASALANKFIKWIKDKLETFGQKFNTDHKREVDYVNKNKEMNDKIADGIANNTFKPGIQNFPLYKIPENELSKINIDDVITKWLNSKDPIDVNKIEAELYPSAIVNDIKNTSDPKLDKIAVLTNYVLYSQPKPGPMFTGAITTDIWNDIIESLTKTGNLIESKCKTMSQKLVKACTDLQNKIKTGEIKSAVGNNNTTPEDDISSRATQLLKIVQSVASTYYTTQLNALSSKFYKTNYTMYTTIVKLYQQQSTNVDQQSNGQNTPQTEQQKQDTQKKIEAEGGLTGPDNTTASNA